MEMLAMNMKAYMLTFGLSAALPVGVFAGPVIETGFDTYSPDLGGNGSSVSTSIGFGINFFTGTDNLLTQLNVNENGNVTFGGGYSGFADDLNTASLPIIAPFYGPVNTQLFGGEISFGFEENGFTKDGKQYDAFGVTWSDVATTDFSAGDDTNTFQLLLVDRHDPDNDGSSSPGDFDIVFNYNQILWDEDVQVGDPARVGFSAQAGTSGNGDFFQLPGSNSSGAFLDSNNETGLIQNRSVHNSTLSPYFRSVDSGMDGRYVYQFRSNFDSPQPVPTPSALLLLGSGLLGLAFARRHALNG
jgi:hypothetical protein